MILLLLFMAAGAAAQDDDVYRTLALGDRVQLTFKNGGTIAGNLVAPPVADPRVKIESVDFAKVPSLTLDLSWEYPGVNGTTTVGKADLKAVKKLQKLDPETRRRLEEEKAKIRKQLEAENAERKAEEEKREKEALEEAKRHAKEEEIKQGGDLKQKLAKEKDDLQKGLDLLAKYPPPEWGQKTLDEIKNKNVRHQNLTPGEKDFLDGYELWLKAKDYTEKEKGKAPEAPAPEKKEEKAPEEKRP